LPKKLPIPPDDGSEAAGAAAPLTLAGGGLGAAGAVADRVDTAVDGAEVVHAGLVGTGGAAGAGAATGAAAFAAGAVGAAATVVGADTPGIGLPAFKSCSARSLMPAL
jgi:hypothetical protein